MSAPTSVLIRPLQRAVYDYLRDDVPDLSPVRKYIFSRFEKNISTEIRTALESIGITIQVFAPRIARIRPNANGLLAEHPLTNKTEYEVGILQELLLYHLHLWTPPGDIATTLHAAEDPVDELPHQELNIMDLFFQCSGGFSVRSA
jgi:hypothetical protein